MGMNALLIKLVQILLGAIFMGDALMPNFHLNLVFIALYSPRYTSSIHFITIFSFSLTALLHITLKTFISIVYFSIIC